MKKQFVSRDECFATLATMESCNTSMQSHVVFETTWGLESSRALKKNKLVIVVSKYVKIRGLEQRLHLALNSVPKKLTLNFGYVNI